MTEVQPTPMGVPMNVYDYLDAPTLTGINAQLDTDATLDSFLAWLGQSIEAGTIRQIVAEHIARWNQLKAGDGEHLDEYQAYTRARLKEWAPLGLEQPSLAMFGASKPATSTKQSRNGPCHCGSGLKFKRCHG